MTKKINKSRPLIPISPLQVGHIVKGTVKNMLDMKVNVDIDGIRFLLLLDCVFPKQSFPIDQEPESDEDVADILCSHMVSELGEFTENILRIKWEDGQKYRAISTIPLNSDNLPEFIEALSDLDACWSEMEDDINQQEDLKNKIKGKNIVQGNNTIN